MPGAELIVVAVSGNPVVTVVIVVAAAVSIAIAIVAVVTVRLVSAIDLLLELVGLISRAAEGDCAESALVVCTQKNSCRAKEKSICPSRVFRARVLAIPVGL